MAELGETTDPGRLVDGDPSAVREQSARWETHAKTVDAATTEHRAATIEPWRGAGATAFESARGRHLSRAAAAASAYRQAASVLAAHAAEIENGRRIAEKAVREWERGEGVTATARRAYEAEQSRSRAAPFALPVPTVFVDPGTAIRDNAEALLADARDAVRTSGADAARALRALADRAVTGSVFAAAGLPTTVAEVMARADEEHLLRDLRLLSGPALAAYAAAHPDLLDRLLALGPARIAPWWRGLDDATRERVAHSIPRVIGNLDGVDARTRSAVNARLLTDDIAAAEDRIRDAEKLLGSPDAGTRASARALIDRDEKLLAQLRAIRTAFGAGPDGTPPHQLYAYHPGDRTMVALSTGLIDDAEHVSLIVPGMGTTAGDVGRYAAAAASLRDLQARLSGGDASALAVVAWLDYAPPGGADLPGVLQNDLAEVGADRLVHTMQGLQAINEWTAQSPRLSVVAHSYGTNVAAIALSRPDAGAGNLVMLGSAGVSGVPVAGALNVPLGQVFATQGTSDEWAPLGQLLSGRTDPTSPGYGARVFTSEGTTIDGRDLAGVTGHGPIGTEEAPSYLNGLTASQYATALATMGRGDELAQAGSPDDRFGWRTEERIRKWGR